MLSCASFCASKSSVTFPMSGFVCVVIATSGEGFLREGESEGEGGEGVHSREG